MLLGDRLKYARDRSGLTLAEVAERTGVGQSSLSEFENGKREPRMAQLQALARAYRRSVGFFLDEGPIPVETVLWRQRPQSPAAEEIEATFLRLCQQYHNLETWCEDRKLCRLPLAESGPQGFGYPQAESLAHSVRTRLQLGERPGTSLLRVLEEVCGVKVFYLSFEPTGTAASAVSETFGAAILLNAKNVRWRRNFDLAHELFHVLTWSLFRKNGDADTASEQEEKWATCFARNLLMPREALQSALASVMQDGRISRQAIFDLAREFDVSVEALVRHIAVLYKVSDERTRQILAHYQALASVYERRGRDDPPELPDRYFALALKALRGGEMSLGRFAEYLGITRREAKGYLDEETAADEAIQITPA